MAQQVGRYVYPLIAALNKLGGSARPSEVYPIIASDLKLSDRVLNATRKDGASQYENHVQWARLYLVRTGYLDKSQKGVWTLTEKGRSAKPFTDTELQEVLRQAQRPWKGIDTNDDDVAERAEQELNPADVEEDTDYRAELLAVLRGLHRPGLNVCANVYCANRVSSKYQ
jgi:restriction system protein